jgi:hypothetical protein
VYIGGDGPTSRLVRCHGDINRRQRDFAGSTDAGSIISDAVRSVAELETIAVRERGTRPAGNGERFVVLRRDS